MAQGLHGFLAGIWVDSRRMGIVVSVRNAHMMVRQPVAMIGSLYYPLAPNADRGRGRLFEAK
jgi:hypothetical protein